MLFLPQACFTKAKRKQATVLQREVPQRVETSPSQTERTSLSSYLRRVRSCFRYRRKQISTLLLDGLLQEESFRRCIMNEYISSVINCKSIIQIAKEWLEAGLISKAEYKKLCRIIAKDCSLDLCSIFLEIG